MFLRSCVLFWIGFLGFSHISFAQPDMLVGSPAQGYVIAAYADSTDMTKLTNSYFNRADGTAITTLDDLAVGKELVLSNTQWAVYSSPKIGELMNDLTRVMDYFSGLWDPGTKVRITEPYHLETWDSYRGTMYGYVVKAEKIK